MHSQAFDIFDWALGDKAKALDLFASTNELFAQST